MIASEVDRVGIPIAQITTMTPIAKTVGVNRILLGFGITNPTGNASLPILEEKKLRGRLIEKAIDILGMEIAKPTVFQL